MESACVIPTMTPTIRRPIIRARSVIPPGARRAPDARSGCASLRAMRSVAICFTCVYLRSTRIPDSLTQRSRAALKGRSVVAKPACAGSLLSPQRWTLQCQTGGFNPVSKEKLQAPHARSTAGGLSERRRQGRDAAAQGLPLLIPRRQPVCLPQRRPRAAQIPLPLQKRRQLIVCGGVARISLHFLLVVGALHPQVLLLAQRRESRARLARLLRLSKPRQDFLQCIVGSPGFRGHRDRRLQFPPRRLPIALTLVAEAQMVM